MISMVLAPRWETPEVKPAFRNGISSNAWWPVLNSDANKLKEFAKTSCTKQIIARSAKRKWLQKTQKLNTTASLVASWLVCQVSQNESHTTRPGPSQWMLRDKKNTNCSWASLSNATLEKTHWSLHHERFAFSISMQSMITAWGQETISNPYIERMNRAIGEWTKSNTMIHVQLSLKLSFAATMSIPSFHLFIHLQVISWECFRT